MITPADIANPDRKSGFEHVGYNASPGTTVPKPYQAYDSRSGGPTKKHRWKGPRRATARQAAWDWCAHAAGLAKLPTYRVKMAGHSGQRGSTPRDEEVEAALGVLRDHRAQKRGRPGFVYCISDGTALKIGYSVKPEARVGELQTGNPRVLRLLAKKSGTEEDERALHTKYIKDNILQEWFRPSAPLLLEFGIKEGLLP